MRTVAVELRRCANCGESIVESTYKPNAWVHFLTAQSRCFLQAKPSEDPPRKIRIPEHSVESMKQQHAYAGERRL